MKLISLIDKQKNIIIFDKKYEVVLEDKDCLTITKIEVPFFEEDRYFYDENIVSLTCIAGKNGTGKTTFLNEIFNRDKSKALVKIFSSIQDDKELIYVISNNDSLAINIPENTNISKSGNEEFDSVFKKNKILFYSGVIEPILKNNPVEGDLSSSGLLSKLTYDEMVRFDMNNQLGFLYNSGALRNSLWRNELSFENKQVRINLSEFGKVIWKQSDIFHGEVDIWDFSYEKWAIDLFREVGERQKFISEMNKRFHESHVTKVLLKYFLSMSVAFLNKDNKDETPQKYLIEIIESGQLNKNKNDKFDFKEFLNELDKKIRDTLYATSFEELKEAFIIGVKAINKLSGLVCNFWENDEEVPELTDLISCISSESDVVRELYSVISPSWVSISSGEYNLFNIFGRIYGNINDEREEAESLILLMDEIDLGLHPSWQLKWMNLFLSGIKFYNKKIQVIFSTHSPLLLTDIPDKNILFLETYKKPVTDYEVGTFGQNIQNLLTDSFFVKETIGDFSKIKIKKIAKCVRRFELVISEELENIYDFNKLDNIDTSKYVYKDDILKDLHPELSKYIDIEVNGAPSQQNLINDEKRRKYFEMQFDKEFGNEYLIDGIQPDPYLVINYLINQIGDKVYRGILKDAFHEIKRSKQNEHRVLEGKIESLTDKELEELLSNKKISESIRRILND